MRLLYDLTHEIGYQDFQGLLGILDIEGIIANFCRQLLELLFHFTIIIITVFHIL